MLKEQEETPEEKREKRAEKAKLLLELRRQEAAQLREELLERQFRENCDPPRKSLSFKMTQKTLEESVAGDNIGVLLRGVQKEDLQRGMVLAKPGSITPHTQFESQVYILTKEEGGRHTSFFAGYRPQFYVRTTDVTGKIESFKADDNSEIKMVMPGDRIKMQVTLIQPIAIEKGMRFAIREGGRTVGAGVISNIIE